MFPVATPVPLAKGMALATSWNLNPSIPGTSHESLCRRSFCGERDCVQSAATGCKVLHSLGSTGSCSCGIRRACDIGY